MQKGGMKAKMHFCAKQGLVTQRRIRPNLVSPIGHSREGKERELGFSCLKRKLALEVEFVQSLLA